MLNSIDNFIFDLDGTIINSSQEVLLCLKKAFQTVNYEIDEKKLNSDIIGPPLRDIVKNIAPKLDDEDMITEIIKNFRRIYDYDENDVSVLYDGIYEFLLFLKQKNKKLFIATFKPEIPTLRILKKFNLDMFDDVYTIDKFKKTFTKIQMIEDIIKRYNLDKEKTVMIGDAVSDILAAKENNVLAIGALWGYGNNKTQLIAQSDMTIKSIEELKNV